ncbi:hypothetical protein AB0H69_00295 [Streptomyces phaeochromogenes]|uniref:hypothetical protein n=1 Tax=Streptomyces phaeochromogenes TaxID=1923 RepID=UPI0033F04A66
MFGGQHLKEVEFPDPCRSITITLCDEVFWDLENWAETAGMAAADLAAALIAGGLEGGERNG